MGYVYKTVGLVLNAGKIIGFRLVDIAEPNREGGVLNLPTGQLNAFMQSNYRFSNMYFDVETKTFKLNSGDLKQLPWYDANTLKVLKRTDGSAGIIVTVAEYKKDDKVQGYAVIDGSGKVFMLNPQTYDDWQSKYKFFEEDILYSIDMNDVMDSAIDYALNLDGSKAPRRVKSNNTPTADSSTTAAPAEPKERKLMSNLKKRDEGFKETAKANEEPVLESKSVDATELQDDIDLSMGIPIGDGVYAIAKNVFVIKGISDEKNTTIMCKDYVNGNPISVVSRISRLTALIGRVRPFYGALFRIMDKIPVSDIPTMCTDGVRMYYNPVFTASYSEAEVLFILLHELYHAMMLHHVRRGERDAYLFNVACDLFINKTLQEEFNLSSKFANVPLPVYINNSPCDVKICVPASCLYSEDVNTSTDTPESIYAELKANLEQEQQQSQSSGNSDNQQQDGDSQNSQSDSGNSQQQQNSNSSSQQGDQGDSDSQSDSNSQDDSTSSGQSAGSTSGAGGTPTSSRSNGSGRSNHDKGLGQYAGRDLTFRGKKVGSLPEKGDGEGQGQGKTVEAAEGNGNGTTDDAVKGYVPDIIQKWPAEETAPIRENATRNLIEQAVQIVKKSPQYSNDSAESIMGRLVAKAQAPILGWKTALAHMMGHAISDYTRTLQRPDRRFVSRNSYYPGKKPVKEGLDNIYFCIDTSGSITDNELGIVFEQIGQLLKMPKFKKVKAKVLFWDTTVCGVEDFEGLTGFNQYLHKAKPVGGGGTNVNCVFEYMIDTKHIRGTVLPEPYVLAIFTDGYFGQPDGRYAMFKDTLWIISQQSGDSEFKNPWGKMVTVKSFVNN